MNPVSGPFQSGAIPPYRSQLPYNVGPSPTFPYSPAGSPYSPASAYTPSSFPSSPSSPYNPAYSPSPSSPSSPYNPVSTMSPVPLSRYGYSKRPYGSSYHSTRDPATSTLYPYNKEHSYDHRREMPYDVKEYRGMGTYGDGYDSDYTPSTSEYAFGGGLGMGLGMGMGMGLGMGMMGAAMSPYDHMDHKYTDGDTNGGNDHPTNHTTNHTANSFPRQFYDQRLYE